MLVLAHQGVEEERADVLGLGVGADADVEVGGGAFNVDDDGAGFHPRCGAVTGEQAGAEGGREECGSERIGRRGSGRGAGRGSGRGSRQGDLAEQHLACGTGGGGNVAGQAVPAQPCEQCEGHRFLGLRGQAQVVAGADGEAERRELLLQAAPEGSRSCAPPPETM